MQCPPRILALAAGLALSGAALAQAGGSLRWPSAASPVGLQAGPARTVPCGGYAFACRDSTSVPLYSSASAPRSLSLQLGPSSPLHAGRDPGLDLSLVGRTGLMPGWGAYGRIGTFHRSGPLATALAPAEGGITYGVGLSWDFSRSASAAVGLDSYDVRGAAGEARETRTSLGLQWRY